MKTKTPNPVVGDDVRSPSLPQSEIIATLQNLLRILRDDAHPHPATRDPWHEAACLEAAITLLSKNENDTLEKIKLACLTGTDGASQLSRILRLCIDAGVTMKLDALMAKHSPKSEISNQKS